MINPDLDADHDLDLDTNWLSSTVLGDKTVYIS